MEIWSIEKEPGGATYWLKVGRVGSPTFKRVDGLSRKQGEALGAALYEVERVARFRALQGVRDALEIKTT